jgi:hypothetical protein
MSDGGPALDAEASDLLLEILELRRPLLSGAAAELQPHPASMLVSTGLLVPHDYEEVSASLADHADMPVSLTWSDQHGGLAYFSPAVGPVRVPDERLARHVVDIPAALRTFMAEMDLRRGWQPHALIDDVLWEVGDVRLEKRPARLPIWFARRLFDPAIVREVIDAATARPHSVQRVILTSTRTSRLGSVAVPGAAVVALADVRASFTGLSVSPAILGARLRGVPAPAQGPLVLSDDGTLLTINGSVQISFKSEAMITAIRRLVSAFQNNKRVPIRDLTDHGSLARLFGGKRWALLQPYINSVKRILGFQPVAGFLPFLLPTTTSFFSLLSSDLRRSHSTRREEYRDDAEAPEPIRTGAPLGHFAADA